MYKHFFKRVIDFFIALILSPFILLVTIFVAIAIKIDDGGSVFYNANRIGKGGKLFKMYKFRSMKVNSPDLRLPDGSTFNSVNDPRLTKVGKFLRKTSIDELPQIYNVLFGKMSFIGPRPDSPSFLGKHAPDELCVLDVRPGITGYNQAINRNSVLTKEKIRNDVYYVQHLSFAFDCKIVWLTIKSVISRKIVYRVTAFGEILP